VLVGHISQRSVKAGAVHGCQQMRPAPALSPYPTSRGSDLLQPRQSRRCHVTFRQRVSGDYRRPPRAWQRRADRSLCLTLLGQHSSDMAWPSVASWRYIIPIAVSHFRVDGSSQWDSILSNTAPQPAEHPHQQRTLSTTAFPPAEHTHQNSTLSGKTPSPQHYYQDILSRKAPFSR
jgi:hypothetical protein